jgi:predicted negative regulator of RcsB-dependent stress response
MNDARFSTKDFLIMVTLMLACLVLFCFALYQYDQTHNASAQAVTKARASVSAATKVIDAAQARNKALLESNDVLTAQNTQLQQQKTQFCTELSKAKIVDPLCSQ